MMRLPWPTAAAARARGLLAEAEGDLERAEESWSRRLRSAGRSAGRSSSAAASSHLEPFSGERGRNRRLAQPLEQALDLFDGLGARPWAARAGRELGRIGGRKTPQDGLSTTETEIVELVVAGRSNKEVAPALHLSPKTVEWNLSKGLSKLGVHSRTELAATSADRD